MKVTRTVFWGSDETGLRSLDYADEYVVQDPVDVLTFQGRGSVIPDNENGPGVLSLYVGPGKRRIRGQEREELDEFLPREDDE